MAQLLLALIYIVFISLGLPDALLGSAWPSMQPVMGVPVSYAGIISMIIAASTIVSSLLNDRMMYRFGTGKIAAASVSLTAVALVGFSVSEAFWQLCLWAVPYGLGAGAVDASLNSFVSQRYKAKHMNWLHCFWGIGATAGPYIMGFFLTRGSWQWGYRTISIIQVVLAAALALSLPLWSKQEAVFDENITLAPPMKMADLLRIPQAKMILVVFFCYCSIETTVGLWSGTYMVLTRGIPAKNAAFLIGLFYFGITGGRFLSGLLSIKMNNNTLVRIGQMFIFGGIIVFGFGTIEAFMGLGLFAIGLGCAPIFPSLLHQTPERFGRQAAQSMMGLQMASAYIGSSLTPLAIGVFSDWIGIQALPGILVGILLLMTLLIECCIWKNSGKNDSA